VHPAALKTLVGMGVVTGGLRSKHWSEVAKGSFDRVVSLCDIARDELPDEFLGRNHVHWSIPDPAAVEGPKRKREAAFAAAAARLRCVSLSPMTSATRCPWRRCRASRFSWPRRSCA